MTEAELRRALHLAFDTSEPSGAQLRARLVLPTRRSRLSDAVFALAGATAIGLVVTVVVVTMLGGAGHASQPAATPTHSATPALRTSHVVSLERAKADSPDQLWGAGWLPFVSTAPQLQEIDSPSGKSESTTLYYRARSGEHAVLINEFHIPRDFQPIGASKPTTINGQPAMFTQIGSDGSADAVTWMLPNGHYVTVQGIGLSEPELVRVAESLRVL